MSPGRLVPLSQTEGRGQRLDWMGGASSWQPRRTAGGNLPLPVSQTGEKSLWDLNQGRQGKASREGPPRGKPCFLCGRGAGVSLAEGTWLPFGLGGQQSQPFTQLPCAGALRGPPLLFLWGLRSPPREHGLGSPALASRGWGGGVSSIWLSIICQMARGGQDKCF